MKGGFAGWLFGAAVLVLASTEIISATNERIAPVRTPATQLATTISGSHSTAKFTELAIKHFSCAGLWRVRARSGSPFATVTVGCNTTLLNRPTPSRPTSITPSARSVYAVTVIPASAARCRYQSLWQADNDATSSSSGFQRERSPRKAGSAEP